MHVRARHHDLGPHGLQVKDLLLAHLVGNDEEQPVALLARNQRKPQAGIAGGGLDQRAARLDKAGALGGFDEIEADAVLDRAAGVLVLELEKDAAGPGCRDVARQAAAFCRSCRATLSKDCRGMAAYSPIQERLRGTVIIADSVRARREPRGAQSAARGRTEAAARLFLGAPAGLGVDRTARVKGDLIAELIDRERLTGGILRLRASRRWGRRNEE